MLCTDLLVASKGSAAGRTHRTHLGAYFVARMLLDTFSLRNVYLALLNLEGHLRRGGYCSIAADTTKAYAAFSSQVLLPGSTIIQTSGSPFPSGVQTNGYPDVTLANGDEVVLQSVWPDSTYEYATVSSHVGDRITLTAGTIFAHRPPVMVRHIHMFPAMVLAQDAPPSVVTATHGLWYTLDLPLEEDPAAWVAAAGLGGAPLAQPSSSVGPRFDDWVKDQAQNNAAAGGGSTRSPRTGR